MCTVFVDGVDSGHGRSDGLALEHCFLLAFREQRDIVVHVFENNVNSCLTGQLLDAVILSRNFKFRKPKGEKQFSAYLNTNSQIVLFDILVVEWMVHFDIGPSVAVVGALLQVKRVVLVRLGCGTANQPVENSWVVLDSGAIEQRALIKPLQKVRIGSLSRNQSYQVYWEEVSQTHTRTPDADTC